MKQFKATSTDSKNFNLTVDNIHLGNLKYLKWYSFQAGILLADNSQYQLEPKGFWDSRIELLQSGESLADYKLSWKGIIINTKFDDIEKSYLLKQESLFSSKFVLVNSEEKEVLSVESDFKWNTLHLDYLITVSDDFDYYVHKGLFLLTILHCINYYLNNNERTTV